MARAPQTRKKADSRRTSKRAVSARKNGKRTPSGKRSAAPRSGNSIPEGPPRTRGLGRGGHRLAEAFAAVERLPVLAESQRRLQSLVSKPAGSEADVTNAVEGDVALVIAVLRAAADRGVEPGRVWGVADAVSLLSPQGVADAAEEVDAYELFEPPAEWQDQLEPLRRHSIATRHATVRIAELGGHANWDELGLAAMLHDVGTLVLARLYPGYSELVSHRGGTPEERIQAERRELGIDHALVGGVLTRRWSLPPSITTTVERHHGADPEGPAAVVALADQVAHHGHGDPVSPQRVAVLGDRAGIDPDRLTGLLVEFPHVESPRRRAPEPCPLSARELDALRGLAQGKVYKEIAEDLSLSASTVRTHLHNVYRKLGAIDRAQAVLIARDRGWI
jgi:DNA-binding CsgD family transcriptional regulator/HD-like signal output (HDOD) protein